MLGVDMIRYYLEVKRGQGWARLEDVFLDQNAAINYAADFSVECRVIVGKESVIWTNEKE